MTNPTNTCPECGSDLKHSPCCARAACAPRLIAILRAEIAAWREAKDKGTLTWNLHTIDGDEEYKADRRRRAALESAIAATDAARREWGT